MPIFDELFGKLRRDQRQLPARSDAPSPSNPARGRLSAPGRLILSTALILAVVAWFQFRRATPSISVVPAGGDAGAGTGTLPGGGIMPWLAKKLTTMRELGVAGSIERIVIKIENGLFLIQDHWFDVVHGTDTAREVHLADLDIRSEHVERGGRYAPASARSFNAIMKSLDVPPGSVFVDIGSGKGKTLLLASEFGFKRVVGVEFAGELNAQARRNWTIYRKGREANPDFEVVTIDAAEYDIKDDENVFYLFNPFDDVVMNKFLRNLDASLARMPRPIWVIYQNPVNQDVFERHGAFRLVRRFGQRGNTVAIYTR